MKKEKELQEKASGNSKLKMTVGILALTVLCIVELYLMMNYFNSYLLLGVVGLAILCCVYWVTDLAFQMQNEKESALEKEFENLYKAQKVSYVTAKQGFLKMEEILDDLGDDLAFPSEEVVQTQKAIGRVTIQKNKENSEAVVASNEKLIEQLSVFESRIADISSRMDKLQEDVLTQGQQQIMELLQRIEAEKEPSARRAKEMMDTLSNIELMMEQGAGKDNVSEFRQEIMAALEKMETAVEQGISKESGTDYKQEIMAALEKMETSMKNETSKLEENMEAKMNEISSAVKEEQSLSPEELDSILNEASMVMETIQIETSDSVAGEGTAGGAGSDGYQSNGVCSQTGRPKSRGNTRRNGGNRKRCESESGRNAGA